MQGLTVCVDYADMLERTLPYWCGRLDSVVVVTTPHDTETKRLAWGFGCTCYETERFYAGTAKFNKGGALREAYERHIEDGWVCVFDADVAPPDNWEQVVKGKKFSKNTLYGAKRVQAPEMKAIPDSPREMPGYFWIFHTSDPHIPTPIWGDWKHAGNYDTEFKNCWPQSNRKKLPMYLIHYGEPRKNWWGRGNTQDMETMQEERRNKGDYEHERVYVEDSSAGPQAESITGKRELIHDINDDNLCVVACAVGLPAETVKDWQEWADSQKIDYIIVTHVQAEVYSPAIAANFGVKRALRAGYEFVVKTDIDCRLDSKFLEKARTMEQNRAIAPVIFFQDESGGFNSKQGPAGTVAMRAADWDRLCGYDERMAGHGHEDGELLERAKKRGLKVERPQGQYVWHYLHETRIGSKFPRRRNENVDCWRKTGKRWENRNWGSGKE